MNPNAKKMDVDDVPRQRPSPANDQHSNPCLATLTKNGDVPAALAYSAGAITGIVLLLWGKFNRKALIRFHAFQSIFTHGGVLLLRTIVANFTGEIGVTIAPLITLATVCLFGFLMYKAYRGDKFVLPLIGSLAERQAAPSEPSATNTDARLQ